MGTADNAPRVRGALRLPATAQASPAIHMRQAGGETGRPAPTQHVCRRHRPRMPPVMQAWCAAEEPRAARAQLHPQHPRSQRCPTILSTARWPSHSATP